MKHKKTPSVVSVEESEPNRLSQSAAYHSEQTRPVSYNISQGISMTFPSKEGDEKVTETKTVKRLQSERSVKKSSQKHLLGNLPHSGSQVVGRSKKKHRNGKGKKIFQKNKITVSQILQI